MTAWPTRHRLPLRGVIDLREVKRVRPSGETALAPAKIFFSFAHTLSALCSLSLAADATAPEHAIDLVLSGRTYVLVPQPATAEERDAWVQTWAQTLRADVIAPELHGVNSSNSSSEGGSSSQAPAASQVSSWITSAAARLSGAAPPPPPAADDTGNVLARGWLHKLPVKSVGSQRSMSATSLLKGGGLLSDFAGWKRRYFLLKDNGLLQWFKDDPSRDGEFLGVLRLTSGTTVLLEKGEQRLRVTTASETLLLKDETAGGLGMWESAIRDSVQSSSKKSDDGGAPADDLVASVKVVAIS